MNKFVLNMAVFTAVALGADRERSCITELPVPLYTAVAWKARVSGAVSIKVTIDSKGAPQLEIGSEAPYLAQYVRTELKKSQFEPSCAGQTITITLFYRLLGVESSILTQHVLFKGLNVFEIVANPPPRIQSQPE